MTILEGLKKIKRLKKKADKALDRITENCCSIEGEPPMYELGKLIQSRLDILKEISSIKNSIQHTNTVTRITSDEKAATISEAINYKESVLKPTINTYKQLSKSHKSDSYGHYGNRNDPPKKIILHYDPKERDKLIDKLEDEVDHIDNALDLMNTKTELV